MNAIAVHPMNNKYFAMGGLDKKVHLYENIDLSGELPSGTLI